MGRLQTVVLCLAWALLPLAGCARGQAVTGKGGVRVITQEEIQASDARDALELIQQDRPVWLAGSLLGDPSDPTERGGPSVLINDIPPKPLFSLQFIRLKDIREIQFLTRTYAETRFRVGAADGLILVLTHSPVNIGDSIPPDTGVVRGSRAMSGQEPPLSQTNTRSSGDSSSLSETHHD